jgi:hypothetical protein
MELGRVLAVWRTTFCHCCSNIEDSSALSNRPSPRLANSTTSRYGSLPGKWRKNSRVTRLIRLRWTADRTFFLAMTKPSRCLGLSLIFANTSKCWCEARASGLSNTRLYSTALSKRFSLPKLVSAASSFNLLCYADRRLRPLARRRFITRRPPLVAMRERKPWVRLRLRTLG